MRIGILTVGTHGDARPFAAFGRRLQARGYAVTIIADAAHRPLIERTGLAHAAIDADFAGLMECHKALIAAGNQLRVGREMAQAVCDWAPRWVEQGMDATSDADLVIGSGSGTVLAGAIAERRGLPFVQAQFMPLTPSRFIPPLWPLPRRRYPDVLNLALSHAVRLATWRMMARSTQLIRQRLGLPGLPWRGPWHSPAERGRNRPILYAFSRHLQPPPPDWPAQKMAVTGSWFLDEAAAWTPPAALVQFLASGPAPIYVGFGSMIGGSGPEFTRIVLDAIGRSGRRAIVATGWGGLQLPDSHDRRKVCGIEQAPHDWLFPRVSMAVHHGGAGTTAAAARAGLPQIIIPFVADQFFWAWRLNALGLNPVPLHRRKLTAADLAAAIEAAARDGVVTEARRLGALIRTEDGAGNAIAALERWGMVPGEGVLISRVPARTA